MRSLDEVHAVAVGEGHACAVDGADRIVSCWGMNDRGRVGDMTMELPRVPTEVEGVRDVAVVRPGQTHTCAANWRRFRRPVQRPGIL